MKIEMLLLLLLVTQDIYTFYWIHKYQKYIKELEFENSALKNFIKNIGGKYEKDK